MNIDELAARLASDDQRRRFIVITEVTRMSGGYVCVAGIDVATRRIIRPLQWNHRNWPESAARGGLQPGAIVSQRLRLDQRGNGFPHQSEDVQFDGPLEIVEQLGQYKLYELLLPLAERTTRAVFGVNLIDNAYVIDGTNCPSLGSIVLPAERLRLFRNAQGRNRASYRASPRLECGRQIP